jgi:hypothetical protein
MLDFNGSKMLQRGGMAGALFVALVCASAAPGAAAPLDRALQQQLLDIYAQYGKDIVAGDLTAAAALRTAKTRGDILAEEKKSPKELADDLVFMRGMQPDSIAPLHANGDATRATIVATASKVMPSGVHLNSGLKPGQVVHSEVTLEFERESGEWKLGDTTFGPDQANIKRCHDSAHETIRAYDDASDGSTGGVIRRVDFEPDHTLVVIDVVGEENCLILPDRTWLSAHHADPGKLVPWATIEADGYPHRTDKDRFWANKWTVTDE